MIIKSYGTFANELNAHLDRDLCEYMGDVQPLPYFGMFNRWPSPPDDPLSFHKTSFKWAFRGL